MQSVVNNGAVSGRVELCERPSILIVDDEDSNLKYLSLLLSKDYDVVTTNDVYEAISIVENVNFYLIITDILMPGMSGHCLCMLIKGNPLTRDIPILFLTGIDSEVDELRALELGGSDFVNRPVHPSILKARVKNLVQAQHGQIILKKYAMYDELTSLPNRRYFVERAEQEWLSCQRDDLPLSVIVIDIDYFKKYNDHYGHAQGDFCLRKVAEILKSALKRPRDFIARTGGEEFVCILPEADFESAALVCERIRRSVESARIAHKKSDVSDIITVSLGFECAVSTSIYRDYGEVVKKADEFLYQSKLLGRNRICSIQSNTFV
ncbi:GGDEF domain-containing response regulator [Zhongshania sp. BJYM1]|uniref:GGDEF domain-containing response regulator n=1 Tax=Zhongshania aquatica TaxID=2965069 RepID=UPI0022B2BB29|nr:diguanylate cyclase [Marortus sp. BJYM1]